MRGHHDAEGLVVRAYQGWDARGRALRQIEPRSDVHRHDRLHGDRGGRRERQHPAKPAVAAAAAAEHHGRVVEWQRAGGAEHVDQGGILAVRAEQHQLA